MKDIFFMRDALKNNTYSLDAVEKAVNHIQMSSFHYLHQVQIDMTGYQRFDFNMSDVKRSNNINHVYRLMPRRWVLYVPGDFIHEGKRLDYKRSKYYEKEIDYDTTLNDRNIFTNTFLVFIDGKLYFEGVNILCKEDKTYCVFNIKEKPSEDNGIPYKEFCDLMERDARITVIFMPNYRNNNITSNAYMIENYNDKGGLPYEKFPDIPSEDSICFVRSKYACVGHLAETEDTGDGIKIKSPGINDIRNTVKDTSLYLNFLEFKYLHKVIDIGIEENDAWFELEIQDYPIAVDNCFIFDEHGNYMHDLKIDMYYPNIYHIIGDRQNKPLKVYIFYFKSNLLLKHKNSLAVFYKYTKDVLDRYKRDSIPEIIKNYKPVKINYNIKDYHGSQYYDDHFKYKTEKMRTLTKLDGEWFREYLIKLALKNNHYLIDVSKIPNMEDKIRHDNSDTKLPEPITFDEPMYMFVFSNEFRNRHDEMTVCVDGIRYNTKYLYKTDYLDFLYIPVRMVTSKTVIEIEKMKEVIRELEFTNNGFDRTSVDIDCKAMQNRPLMNDIFVVDPETDLIISEDDYELYTRVGEDMLEVLSDDLYLPCPSHVEIKLKNEKLFNKPLVMHIKKNYRFFEVDTFYGKDNLYPIKFILDGKHDSRHLRVYRNGRVIPRHIWSCRFPKDYKRYETQLLPGMLRETGDVMTVESLPYKVNQVCYIEKLEPGKIIDLTGKLDKPFDLRWHDIYLNGRKLNRNDVEIISSNKIVIRNTKSLKWLEVVENSRDDEYFGYMPLKDLIDDILDSKDDDGFRDRIEETITGMTDIEDDIITIIITIIDVVMNMFYFDYMVPFYGLLNPDYKQIDQETHDYYHEIMDGEPFLLNADYGNQEWLYRVLPVNPDKEFGEE